MPKSLLQRLQRFAHQLPVALAPTARSRRRRATSTRPARAAAGSKSKIAPRPWQSGHAPCGELNENARGVISGMLMPQSTHASRRENSRSPPSSVLMTTMSSARLSAISTDSVSRRSMPPLDDQPIDDDVDGVVAAAIELDVLFERAELAVDARLGEAARAQRRPAPS